MFRKKGDEAVVAKLEGAPEPYRGIATRLHELVRECAPDLEPVVRWGLAFYVKDGVDVCYIKPDKDFLVFGFAETVNPAFEDGRAMHPVAWTLTAIDDETEATIRALLTKAVA